MNAQRPGSPSSSRAVWLLLPLVLGAGCSGINVSKSVSPLDFILPGLMRVDPPQPLTPDATNTLVCWRPGAPMVFRPGAAPAVTTALVR